MEQSVEHKMETGFIQWFTELVIKILYELESKLLVSPLVIPIRLPYRIPPITP